MSNNKATLKTIAAVVGICSLVGGSAYLGGTLAEKGHDHNEAAKEPAVTASPVPVPSTTPTVSSTFTPAATGVIKVNQSDDEQQASSEPSNSGAVQKDYEVDPTQGIKAGDVDPVTGAKWYPDTAQDGFLSYLGGKVYFGKFQGTPDYSGRVLDNYLMILEDADSIIDSYAGKVKPMHNLDSCWTTSFGYLVCELSNGDRVIMDQATRSVFGLASKKKFTQSDLESYRTNWYDKAEFGVGVKDDPNYKGWYFIARGYPRNLLENEK